MTDYRHQRLTDWVLQALELPPGRREGYLRDRCGRDASLYETALRLVRRHEAEQALEAGDIEDVIERELRTVSIAEQPVPERIGPYRILERLPAGAMGEVFVGVHDDLGRKAAIKVLPRALATPGLRQRFRREIDVVARLQHPGIAALHEAGELRIDGVDTPWFAMEFVDGSDLLRWFRERDVDLEGRLSTMIAVCEAVAHAHERGVVHRDLKSANILVDAEGRPRLLDFGIARVLEDASSEAERPLTSAAAAAPHSTVGVLGTPATMSPEQASGNVAAIGTPSDVYSLGVLLFEAVEGRPPFALHDLSPREQLRVIREDRPRPMRAAVPGRSDLRLLTLKSLSKQPSARYASARELAEDLRRFLEGEPILARRPSLAYFTSKWVRRRPLVLSTAITAAVALVLVGLWWTERTARASSRWEMRKDQVEREISELPELSVLLWRDNGQRFHDKEHRAIRRYLSLFADHQLDLLDARPTADEIWSWVARMGAEDEGHRLALRRGLFALHRQFLLAGFYGPSIRDEQRMTADELRAARATVERLGEEHPGWMQAAEVVLKALLKDSDPWRREILSCWVQWFETGELGALASAREPASWDGRSGEDLEWLAFLIKESFDRASADACYLRSVRSAPDRFWPYFHLHVSANIQADIRRSRGMEARELHQHAYTCAFCMRALRPRSELANQSLGTALVNLGEFEEGRELLTEILEESPTALVTGIYLATALDGLGDREGAIEQLTAVLRHHPLDPVARFNRARLVGQRALDRSDTTNNEELELAILDMVDVIDDEESGWAAAAEVLRLYAQLGRSGEGAEVVDQALARWPREPSVLLNAGVVLENVQRWEEAADSYRRASEERPRYARALAYLGYALCELHRLDDSEDREDPRLIEAAAVGRQAVAVEATPEYKGYLGRTLSDCGELDEAIRLLEASLEADPTDFDSFVELMRAKARRGLGSEVMHELDEALQEGEQDPEIASEIRRLRAQLAPEEDR